MQLARIRDVDGKPAMGVIEGDAVVVLPRSDEYPRLADLLEAPDPLATASAWRQRAVRDQSLRSTELLAPIDQQEVWAAGVTYRRSQTARMEESQGAAAFYDLVYQAARPELFFKATHHRVSGPGVPVRIRADARWNVPEPELALVLNSRLELVAFTVGNDLSSRDIEGENPLYLPQAKVYDACCGLGPWITLAAAMPAPEATEIRLEVRRGTAVAFEGSTAASQMARSYEELVGWLARDNSFPQGAFLLTGTGIVPTDDFTLLAGDLVRISIQGIGTLENVVVQAAVAGNG